MNILLILVSIYVFRLKRVESPFGSHHCVPHLTRSNISTRRKIGDLDHVESIRVSMQHAMSAEVCI